MRKAKPANVTTREEGLTYLDRKRAEYPDFRAERQTNKLRLFGPHPVQFSFQVAPIAWTGRIIVS